MSDLTLTSQQVQNLVEHIVTVFGAAGGSVLGAPFSYEGSTLTIGSHTTIGYDNESMDGWAKHPLQIIDTESLVNQVQNELIKLNLSSYAGSTVFVLAKPSTVSQRLVLQLAEVELVTDLINRSQNGAKDASVLLGSVTLDGDGVILSTDVSIREYRIDNIQEIIDTLNSTGVLDHGSLQNLGNDDHTHYLLADGTRALSGDLSAGSNKITNLAAPTNPNDAARLTDLPPAGITDHGLLDALSLLDDDHTQYLKADGLRPLSGNWAVGNNEITQVTRLKVANGSSGSPSVTFDGDDTTGLYRTASLFGLSYGGGAKAWVDTGGLVAVSQLTVRKSGSAEGVFDSAPLTGARTYSLPNDSGTLALTSDIVGGDTDAIHGNVAGEIAAVALKATPVSGDFLLVEDSAAANAKKRVTVGSLPFSTIDGGAGTDTTAIHDDTAGEISAVALKATPVSGDFILIEDSAAANAKKRITVGTLPFSTVDGGAGTDTTAIHDDTAGEISAVALKGSPVGADLLLIEDSAAGNAKKRVTISSLPSGGVTTFTGLSDTPVDYTGGVGGRLVRVNGGATGLEFMAPLNTWSASNVSVTRAFDADSTSINELADVVGTLIDDMKTQKILG